MRPSDPRPLDPAQLARLHVWLGSPMRRLSRLLERADRCGINVADPALYAAITKARSAVYELLILVHHRSVRRPDGTLNRGDPPAPAPAVEQRRGLPRPK